MTHIFRLDYNRMFLYLMEIGRGYFRGKLLDYTEQMQR